LIQKWLNSDFKCGTVCLFDHWTRCNNLFSSTIYALRIIRLMWKNDQISSSMSILIRFQVVKWIVLPLNCRSVHSKQDPIVVLTFSNKMPQFDNKKLFIRKWNEVGYFIQLNHIFVIIYSSKRYSKTFKTIFSILKNVLII